LAEIIKFDTMIPYIYRERESNLRTEIRINFLGKILIRYLRRE